MEYTVGDLIKDADRKLHSGGVDQSDDFYGALDEARRNLIKKVSPPELVKKSYIEEALYDKIERYVCPQEIKFDEVVNINLLSGYRGIGTLERPLKQVYNRQFHQKRPGSANVFSINYENGVKYMDIFRPRGLVRQSRVIHDANSLTENGTWNSGGNIVNLTEDKLMHLTGTGSLEFDINNSSTNGFIENHTLEEFDLTEFLEKGATFGWFDIPVSDIVTSIKITLGSDRTNLTNDLYEFTVNRPHDGNEFNAGWNLLRFPIKEFSRVGTPDPSSLKYIRFDISTDGNSMSNLHLENIIARNGEVFEVVYNSAYCFLDSRTRVWKKKATTNKDIMVFEEETYQLLMLELALVIQKEIYGNGIGAKSDVSNIENELGESYHFYKEKYPSEMLMPSGDLYIFGDMYSGYSPNQPDFNPGDLW